MSETRQKILHCARELFNNRGYNGVSLQDIADAVGIRKGNLTYYFAKKEDLMEALLTQGEPRTLHAPHTLQDMDDFLRHIQQVVQNNAYYFLYHAQLSQLSPRIAALQEERYRAVHHALKEGFAHLQAAGLLRAEALPGEHDCLIDTLHMACIYWAPFNELRGAPRSAVAYRHHAWCLLHPLLTAKGRAALNALKVLA